MTKRIKTVRFGSFVDAPQRSCIGCLVLITMAYNVLSTLLKAICAAQVASVCVGTTVGTLVGESVAMAGEVGEGESILSLAVQSKCFQNRRQ